MYAHKNVKKGKIFKDKYDFIENRFKMTIWHYSG